LFGCHLYFPVSVKDLLDLHKQDKLGEIFPQAVLRNVVQAALEEFSNQRKEPAASTQKKGLFGVLGKLGGDKGKGGKKEKDDDGLKYSLFDQETEADGNAKDTDAAGSSASASGSASEAATELAASALSAASAAEPVDPKDLYNPFESNTESVGLTNASEVQAHLKQAAARLKAATLDQERRLKRQQEEEAGQQLLVGRSKPKPKTDKGGSVAGGGANLLAEGGKEAEGKGKADVAGVGDTSDAAAAADADAESAADDPDFAPDPMSKDFAPVAAFAAAEVAAAAATFATVAASVTEGVAGSVAGAAVQSASPTKTGKGKRLSNLGSGFGFWKKGDAAAAVESDAEKGKEGEQEKGKVPGAGLLLNVTVKTVESKVNSELPLEGGQQPTGVCVHTALLYWSHTVQRRSGWELTATRPAI
jgi:hypothetical protein